MAKEHGKKRKKREAAAFEVSLETEQHPMNPKIAGLGHSTYSNITGTECKNTVW